MNLEANVPGLEFFCPLNKQLSFDSDEASVHQFVCSPGRLRLTGSQQHTLLFNAGDPLAITYWADFQWNTLIAEKDTAICILPAGSAAEIRWTQPLTLRCLFVDTLHAAKVLDAHPDFHPQWCVTNPVIHECTARLFLALETPQVPEKTYVESLVSLCLHSILWEQASMPADQPARGRLAPRQLSQVIFFAHDSIYSDIGLVDLANLVHLSAYHFGRLFKQTIGLSPYQYLLQMKIEYAKKLILENAGPLGDIAYRLNFSDQAHFSNAFRKATGVSPRRYQHSRLAVL
jgi:AraC family transcriptional regulator